MGDKRALCISALLVIFNLFYSFNATDTITTAQFISDAKNESLLSTNKNFKLGFFSPGKSRNRYVGIWLNKISERTVVWVANREIPIKNSAGIFKIGEDGNLVVFDGNQSNTLWSTNVSVSTRTSRAKLLDSGNLILVAENKWNHSETIIWQSFDYPTDTVLPGMKFGMNRRTGLIHTITSWKSRDDPASGEFSGALDPLGSPQIFTYKSSVPRWRCGPWNGRTLNGLPDVATRLRTQKVDYSNQVDLINYTFVNNDQEFYLSISTNSTLLSIVVLESTGIVKRTIWHESKKWTNFWMAPEDLCDEYARCGANAICNEDTTMHCACLPGFELLYPEDWNSECVETRKEKVNGCGKGVGEGFVRMESVKLPDARISRVYGNMSLNECEKECLKSCNCTGYASADVQESGRGCFAWYGELVDMRQYKDGQDFYLRVDAAELAAYGRKITKSFLENKSTLAFFVVTLVLEAILAAVCCYSWIMRHKRKGQKKKRRRGNMLISDYTANMPNRDSVTPSTRSSAESGETELTLFDLRTLIAATNNFSSTNKLGQGGFGPVYKGRLPNGQEIAIKRLSNNSGQGIMEFKNEVLLIAKLQHRSLVRLLGYCIEDGEKLLIYEFMPNKSLDYFIFDNSRKRILDWKKRFDIILGIARGIVYLHEDSRLRVIHRDLKASNILLDAEMKPRISDFGTARLFGGDQTQENTSKVVGTFGYLSPEYALGGLFSTKSDIFSFGVILLEIISGKKNRGFFHDDPSSNLIRYAWELWRDDKALEIVDSCIADSCPADEVMRCIQVGLLCVQDDAKRRPTMSTAIFMLSNETPLPSPKQSTFGFRRPQKGPDSSMTETRSSINEVTVTTFNAR